MKNLIYALIAFGLSLLLWCTVSPAQAANCSTYPFTLTNGQVADATQVMANFNSILSCANTNLAHNANNSDITSLSGLLTPLSVGQGGTGNTTGAATTLATPRTFSYTGDATGGPTSFDGSANVSTAMTIANDAVTTVKILNAAVTTAKIAAGAVTTTQLGSAAVQPGQVGANAVGTSNITDNAIITTKIADTAVTTPKIVDANVTTAKIADANVTTAKIANNAVTNTQLGSGAAVANIGYTPVNKAGDTVTGNLTVSGSGNGFIFSTRGFATGDSSTVTTIYMDAVNNSRLDYNWSSKKLTWISNGTAIFSVDASGNAIFAGNVTANGTP